MNEVFFLVEEALEGGYTAKAIGESIFTEADTIEELKVNIREAVHCHFDDDKLPKIIRLHLVKEEVIAV
jgi:predicted RNase H-like HicB family nuclease